MTLIGKTSARDFRLRAIGFIAAGILSALPASAQWISQSIPLVKGWNAIFLHVDDTHESLNSIIDANTNIPVTEVWRWNPPSTRQITDAQEPGEVLSEWSSWVRGVSNSVLQRMKGDTAYLVHAQTNYTWTIKGRPVPPRHIWTSSGLNLLGFPTAPTNPPTFAAFLGAASSNDLQFTDANTKIYRYRGGELTNNPVQIQSSGRTSNQVVRGQAFWINSGSVFNRYFGPFEVSLAGDKGPNFGDGGSSYRFRLSNLSRSNITVTLKLLPSETEPAGEDEIVGVPPLIIRGAMNVTNLTYAYQSLPVGGSNSWTLTPIGAQGSEIEVVLGLDRTAMPPTPGSYVAGILRFTDSLNFTEVHVPVEATTASLGGLWVGGASVTMVDTYLKSYESAPGDQLATDTNGAYVVTGIRTNLSAVPAAYPLRLIVHSQTNGSARLLQRVYHGMNSASNLVVATRESALDPRYLSSARRISSTQLPWSEANTGWPFQGGDFAWGGALTARVTTAYDDQASNPFLHTYHPDHDNRIADFSTLQPRGAESYSIERDIGFQITPPGDDFGSRITAGQTLSGTYSETIRLKSLTRPDATTDTRTYTVRGFFSLSRISGITTLTTPP